MDQRRYVGMDVHHATISVAVMDSTGNVVMESIIETKASTILELIRAMRVTLWVTFEEGTSAAWLYDLLKRHVTKVVVCDPRRTRCFKPATRMTESMLASSPICSVAGCSHRFTTVSRAYGPCENWRAAI